MDEKRIYKLNIDPKLKCLIGPLRRKEYLQLEENIIADGCLDPIRIWHGTIIDGHNRYEICTKHQIPFSILEMEFDSREAVIIWICTNQLGRRNISEETRKYLIGIQYEAEKIINSEKNPYGINQHTQVANKIPQRGRPFKGHHITAARIAEENHISSGTVQKYAAYARAVNTIGNKDPKMMTNLLSGRYKISHANTLKLSDLGADVLRQMNKKMENNELPYVQFKKARNAIRSTIERKEAIQRQDGPSVKDMPAYDPDAEITGLTLTIPSWAGSIDRIINSDIENASVSAKTELIKALIYLQDKIECMLLVVKE